MSKSVEMNIFNDRRQNQAFSRKKINVIYMYMYILVYDNTHLKFMSY